MNRTSRSQSTATLVLSPVSHGLWSSLTPCKTMTRLEGKPSSSTTCQSTKMHLNGTTTVFQCPVWSPSKVSPLTGEQLVILWPLAWTTTITGGCLWKTWICLWSPPKTYFVFFPSWSMFVEMNVPTAQFGLLTAQWSLFTWIAGLASNMAHVNSTDRLEG